MNNSYPVMRLGILLLAITAMSACNQEQDISMAEILQKNHAAVRLDGSDVKIDTADLVLRIDEADYSLVARYRASSDGFMRIDLFSGDDRVYSEGKDEGGVWEWPGGAEAPENVFHDGVGALEHGIEFNLHTLAELSGRGHTIELVGTESIRDEQYYVLKVTLKDGFENYRLVNATTWLVDMSRDFRAFHPAIDSTRINIETRYEQWTREDDILFASRSRNVDLDAEKVLSTMEVLSARYNRPREELHLARDYLPAAAPVAR